MAQTRTFGGMTQERIVFALAVLLFLAASVGLNGFFSRRQPGRDRAQRQRARHPGGRHGRHHHRPRHRPLDGRDHGHVGGLVSADAEQRHLRRHRPRPRAGGRHRHRPHQRLPDRLCRRAGDLRHPGQLGLRLWLRALAADRAGRDAGAAGPLGGAARPLPLPRRSGRGVLLLRHRLCRLSVPALSPSGAATPTSWATISWRRATWAFRSGR